MERLIRKIPAGLIAFTMTAVISTHAALADGPSPTPSAPSPKPPPELARRIMEITDAVLEHHVDPPARQQMILAGIKALYQAAGVPVRYGLGRRVSAVATPEQLAAFLADAWPKTTAKLNTKTLAEALIDGLLREVPGGAYLISSKESKVAEQFAGNRYVGIHIALGMDPQEKRPKIFQVFEGGPADRAGVKQDDLLEQIDGVDTKGMDVRQAIERIRGDEGTAVTLTVRQPKESKSRTMTITRGRHVHPTIFGVRKRSSGGWNLRLDATDPIGYVRIAEVRASTPHELHKLAQQMETEGIRALVLDLRGRHGNSVHPAVLLANCLLERCPIGRVRTALGTTTYQAESDALFRGWPMAVLVDQNTSGVAEWLAAALQDNHRAILVGMPTQSARASSGQAIEMSTVPIGDGAWSINLMTGYLERGNGRPLSRGPWLMSGDRGALFKQVAGMVETENNWGIQPDCPVAAGPSGPPRPFWAGERRPGDAHDTKADAALQKALQVLREKFKKA